MPPLGPPATSIPGAVLNETLLRELVAFNGPVRALMCCGQTSLRLIMVTRPVPLPFQRANLCRPSSTVLRSWTMMVPALSVAVRCSYGLGAFQRQRRPDSERRERPTHRARRLNKFGRAGCGR